MDDLFMRGKCHGSLVALGVERWFDGESDPLPSYMYVSGTTAIMPDYGLWTQP